MSSELRKTSSCRCQHGQWRGHRWHDLARRRSHFLVAAVLHPSTPLHAQLAPLHPLDPPEATRRQLPLSSAPPPASRCAAGTTPPRDPSASATPPPILSTATHFPSSSYWDARSATRRFDAKPVVTLQPRDTSPRHLAVLIMAVVPSSSIKRAPRASARATLPLPWSPLPF